MAIMTPHRRAPRLGALVGSSLFGALLAAAGLGIAYLVLATPFISLLSSDGLAGTGRAPIGLGIWSLSLVAGGAILLAGTSRIVMTLGRLRNGHGRSGPAARALASMTDEITVVADVVPYEGRAIPEVVIGPFGAAVIHTLPAARAYRQIGTAWERRTRDGWMPMDNPLDLANRDADRVRRWFSIADLEFVVRVYAAVIVSDVSIPRSSTCAVVTTGQLPEWIGTLPRQRSLTASRRLRLSALATSPATSTAETELGGW